MVRLSVRAPQLECEYALDRAEAPVVALEFNLSLRDERYLESAGQMIETARFDIREPALGVTLTLALDPPATLVHFPIETVSESEEGLERTYQGLCLMCFWSLKSGAGARQAAGMDRAWTSRLRWTVSTTTA